MKHALIIGLVFGLCAERDHGPYWISRGIFSDFQQAIMEYWQPYLDGTESMETAILDLVRAPTTP